MLCLYPGQKPKQKYCNMDRELFTVGTRCICGLASAGTKCYPAKCVGNLGILWSFSLVPGIVPKLDFTHILPEPFLAGCSLGFFVFGRTLELHSGAVEPPRSMAASDCVKRGNQKAPNQVSNVLKCDWKLSEVMGSDILLFLFFMTWFEFSLPGTLFGGHL